MGDFSDVFVCISVAAGVADYGFALTARHFFQTPKKHPKRLAPTFGPRRLGFLRSGTDPGAAAPVCFAAPTLAVYDCVVRSLRSHARINPSTQPSDVAGGSRSRAPELTLIVEWGGFAAGSCAALLLLLWERACSRRRPDSRPVLELVRDPTVGAAEGCDLLLLPLPLLLLWLLIFCPFGRLRYGIDPGVGAQRPYDAVVHSGRRCSEANRSRCARIGPVTKVPRAPASGPYAGAKPFGSFLAFEKGTRCKSETIRSRYRSNGYTPSFRLTDH